MKKFFLQDSVFVGVVAGLGAELVYCVLLTVGMLLAGVSPFEHIRWYAGKFVCLILVLQRYAKRREFPVVDKTLIVVLFITFLPYIVYLLKTNALLMQ